jgi:hypothetical protein
MFPVRYELGFCIPVDDIFHSHSHGNPESYKVIILCSSIYGMTKFSCVRKAET